MSVFLWLIFISLPKVIFLRVEFAVQHHTSTMVAIEISDNEESDHTPDIFPSQSWFLSKRFQFVTDHN